MACETQTVHDRCDPGTTPHTHRSWSKLKCWDATGTKHPSKMSTKATTPWRRPTAIKPTCRGTPSKQPRRPVGIPSWILSTIFFQGEWGTLTAAAGALVLLGQLARPALNLMLSSLGLLVGSLVLASTTGEMLSPIVELPGTGGKKGKERGGGDMDGNGMHTSSPLSTPSYPCPTTHRHAARSQARQDILAPFLLCEAVGLVPVSSSGRIWVGSKHRPAIPNTA